MNVNQLTLAATLLLLVPVAGSPSGAAVAAASGQPVTLTAQSVTVIRWPGGTAITPVAINGAGQVVGIGTGPRANPQAFLWQNGTVTDLPTLGGLRAWALGINASGQVAGWAEQADGSRRGVVWEGGTATELAPLPGDTYSVAAAINDLGEVVGSSYTTDERFGRAVRWDNGVPTALPVPAGALGSNALLINNAGHVVTWARTTAGFSRPGLLRDGRLIDFGPLPPGAQLATPKGLNAADTVVGELDGFRGGTHPFAWAGGAYHDLGSSYQGMGYDSFSYAQGVNNVGQIVGSIGTGSYTRVPAVWRAGGLVTFAPHPSCCPNFTMKGFTAVNDLGVMVGTGSDSDTPGQPGFLLAPPSGGWPAPSASR